MYNLILAVLYKLYDRGHKELSVRVALRLEKLAKSNNSMFVAASQFLWAGPFDVCWFCHGIILPGHDEHSSCEEEIQRQHDEAQYQEQDLSCPECGSDPCVCSDDSYGYDYLDDDDDYASPLGVYSRAYGHFRNHEPAREASEMYPGDFI